MYEAQHVSQEENHQNGAKTDASAATVAPAAIAIVSTTATHQQDQYNDQHNNISQSSFLLK